MKERAHVHSLESIQVGDHESIECPITEEIIASFAETSGDRNPLHVDEAYAASTPFKKRIVHGMLLGAFVSQLIGMKLPGNNALLVKESLEFKKPAYAGDVVTVRGVVTHKSDATSLIELEFTLVRGDETLAVGNALVRVLA